MTFCFLIFATIEDISHFIVNANNTNNLTEMVSFCVSVNLQLQNLFSISRSSAKCYLHQSSNSLNSPPRSATPGDLPYFGFKTADKFFSALFGLYWLLFIDVKICVEKYCLGRLEIRHFLEKNLPWSLITSFFINKGSP